MGLHKHTTGTMMIPKGVGWGLLFFAMLCPHILAAKPQPQYVYGHMMDLVRREYVEEIDPRNLLDATLKGMMGALDAHSAYYTEEEFQSMKDEAMGTFGGIGFVLFPKKDGVIRVVSVDPLGPAEMAGIRPGDDIIAVDGHAVKDLSATDVIKRIKGQPGTPVALKIRRDNEGVKTIQVTRVQRVVNPVSQGIIDHMGYIRISFFNSQTAKSLDQAIGKVLRERPPVKGLILDLRGNIGGLFDQGVAVSERFLSHGPIVHIKGRKKNENKTFQGHGKDQLMGLPMVVLVDGETASSAEIVTGALKDHGRAVVVGAKTFGKGSVQTLYPFPFGGAMKITTAYYYTPSGTSIHKNGIIPDIPLPALVTDVDVSDDEAKEDGEEPVKDGAKEGGPKNGRKDHERPGPALNEDAQILQCVAILKALRLKQSLKGQFP